jgi:hypothetical protein
MLQKAIEEAAEDTKRWMDEHTAEAKHYAQRAEYHARLKQKYLHLMSHLWEVVPPDSSPLDPPEHWRTIEQQPVKPVESKAGAGHTLFSKQAG